jgi:hypothetical protein
VRVGATRWLFAVRNWRNVHPGDAFSGSMR